MNRCFVTHEPLSADGGRLVNLRPAAAFGELTFILPPGRPPADVAAWLPAIDKAMAGYREGDYIVLVGEMDVLAAASIAAARASRTVRFLKWNRDTRNYSPITL